MKTWRGGGVQERAELSSVASEARLSPCLHLSGGDRKKRLPNFVVVRFLVVLDVVVVLLNNFASSKRWLTGLTSEKVFSL